MAVSTSTGGPATQEYLLTNTTVTEDVDPVELERLLFPTQEKSLTQGRQVRVVTGGGVVGYAYVTVGEGDDAELVMHLVTRPMSDAAYTLVPVQVIPEPMFERLKAQYLFLHSIGETTFATSARMKALVARQECLKGIIQFLGVPPEDTETKYLLAEKLPHVRTQGVEASLISMSQTSTDMRSFARGFREICMTLAANPQPPVRAAGGVLVHLLRELMESLAILEKDTSDLWQLLGNGVNAFQDQDTPHQ